MNAMVAALWRDETPYVLGAALALAALLYRFMPAGRLRVRRSLLFFAFWLLLDVVAAIFAARLQAAIANGLHQAAVLGYGVVLIRLSGLSLFRVLLPALHLQTPRILEDVVVIGGYLLWGMVRLSFAGVELSSLVATSAVITAVIAFAMQDTLGNILGGIAIELDNSISLGDWIKVDDIVGKVTDIRWRSTSIETRNWETVVIPNGVLMKSKFQVLGKREGEPVQWRRWIYFEIDPGVPPGRVITTVESALNDAEIPNAASKPAPNCVLLAFEQGNLRYAVRYWLTDLARDDPTDSLVRQHIYTALQRAGIRLSEPEQTVHMVEEDEKHQEMAKARELQRRLQSLKSVDLFANLTKEELQFLAESLVYAPFSRGDTMTRQGNVAHWLYILVAGEAEVVLEAGNGSRTKVGVLPAGSLFGEMGLMTGAPRTATVTAITDVECYRLDKASFATILQSRPELAEDMTHVLIARRGGLEAVRAGQEAAQDAARVAREQGELLGTIKRFFGLA
jgi:small-conductance mechanosensitive channel/CRP-like cAMP-binding protein